MKKVLLIVAAILLTNAVSAQNHEKNILGVRAGLNLSSYSISESGVSVSTDSRAAFHVAVSDQILLCDRLPFYLETGLAFSSRGGKLSGVSFRPSYLQIPVLVNYHFNIKDIVTIQPFAGLYYGLGIGGKMKANGEKDTSSATTACSSAPTWACVWAQASSGTASTSDWATTSAV